MKGMMGLIKDRMSFHSRYNLHEAIVDMVTVLKPHLIVIDGTSILSSGGPGGPGKVIPLNLVVASTDMVAADAQMVALGTWYGKKFVPDQVRHISIAGARLDAWTLINRSAQNVNRDNISEGYQTVTLFFFWRCCCLPLTRTMTDWLDFFFGSTLSLVSELFWPRGLSRLIFCPGSLY
jgi:hypothetical protein